MKYAFCIAEDINLGAAYIIAYLKQQGHEVRLFFDPRQFARGYAKQPLLAKVLSIENYNLKKIKRYNPDACLFSCVTATYQWALHMAKRVKYELPQCKVIFGGVHPTLIPEEVKKHAFIDEVVVGDGIEYFGGKFEPDRLWPDREIFFRELPAEHRRTQLFMTSFGCPFNCSFCGNEQLRKVGKYRYLRRNVDACICELQELKRNGMRYVLFVDDIFTCDKKWLTHFLKCYEARVGLPFACFGHPKFLDKDVIENLKAAGCHTIWIGIQTGHEKLRKDILNRPETNKEIVDACKLVKEHGIKLMVDHIFGIPFESNLTQDISYALYREIKPDVVNCYNLLYFPKSKIMEHAVKCGYLTLTEAEAINRGEGHVYQIGGNRGQIFYDTYIKPMVALPLYNIVFELMPTMLVKLIVHIRAGRWFIPIVMIQNEIFFTWRAFLKKVGLYGIFQNRI